MSTFNYLALGDSYTIGEGVAQRESFPFLLQEKLACNDIVLSTPTIVAQTGWTTAELIQAIEKREPLNTTFDLVTLLIGVNNQYRGLSLAEFEREIVFLVYKAIAFAGGNHAHVLILSIPDYGYTPFGFAEQERIENEINLFNSVLQEVVQDLDIEYVDVTEASRQYSQQAGYLTADQLHPSAKLYQVWVEHLYPRVEKLLCGL